MDLLFQKRPISAWWVYKIKITLDEKLNKLKMKLVAKGYE